MRLLKTVKGAGSTTCKDFLVARAERCERYLLDGGWIGGFLSAANLYEQATDQITPIHRFSGNP